MKKLSALIIALTIAVSSNIYAQKQKNSKDSINVFYNQLFTVLRKGYLYKKDVDWKTVEPETKQKLEKYDNFQASLAEIRPLFDKIKANHCIIFLKDKQFSGTTKKSIIKENSSEQLKKKYEGGPKFEVKILDGKYGYILVPEMVFFDVSAKNIQKIAQPFYDQINKIKINNNLQGWIVDLLVNTGGNAVPMLLTLYDLLGDNGVWGTLDVNKNQIAKYSLLKGKYMSGNKKLYSIDPEGKLLDKEKVAVITGILTGSSGEVTALAFKGRANTIFIGGETYGATTANIIVDLPFTFKMALTVGYDVDRNGVFYDRIPPDILVQKQDDFENLLEDKNIQEAIKYFSKPNS